MAAIISPGCYTIRAFVRVLLLLLLIAYKISPPNISTRQQTPALPRCSAFLPSCNNHSSSEVYYLRLGAAEA